MIYRYIADYVLQHQGYIVLKDTHTKCYLTRYGTSRLIIQYNQEYNKTNLLHNIKYTQSEHKTYICLS